MAGRVVQLFAKASKKDSAAGRKIPSPEGWRAATAVAERRGGFFIGKDHSEVSGFIPYQQAIKIPSCAH